MSSRWHPEAVACVLLSACSGTVGNTGAGGRGGSSVYPDGRVDPSAACTVGSAAASPVQEPVFVRNLAAGETGWFSSPALVDLDGDANTKEIVAPLYSIFLYDSAGRQMARVAQGASTKGRIYAPAVVGDLDSDGVIDVVVAANEGTVAAYEARGGELVLKPGWPASTESGGQRPEGRGIAAGDLDGDGSLEVAVTTTNTSSTGAQVFVFNARGELFQPPSLTWQAWPRYNTATGTGNDADANGMGHQGYGCFGLNVAIGNLDDDAQQEIVATYDNHFVNVFRPDGRSVTASAWFTNRSQRYEGMPLDWGQFIRWYDPQVEEDHYHLHTGEWPDVRTSMWLQWTASPPTVADVDGDGRNEVIGLPNAEKYEPYVTQGHAFMVLEGAYGDSSRSARRLSGWETLPLTGQPPIRGEGDWYPPDGVPSPVVASIVGDTRPEIVAAGNDGFVYAVGPDAALLWKYDYARGAARTFASEPVLADLNQDGAPEVIFGTYSLLPDRGRLVVLANTGAELFDVVLPGQRVNGNGIGVPAAPSVGDLDGDGALEIVLLTFDHGLDVFTVPGSAGNCLPWPTGRGNLLRNSQGPAYKR